jgi:hypothetical protein
MEILSFDSSSIVFTNVTSKITGAAYGAGTAHTSGASELTPGF